MNENPQFVQILQIPKILGIMWVLIKYQQEFFWKHNSEFSEGKGSAWIARDLGLIPGSGRSKAVLPDWIAKYMLSRKYTKFYNMEAKIHINQLNRKNNKTGP